MEPKNANELRLKTLKGIELTEDDIWDYNNTLGEQAKEMIIKIKTRLEEVRVELKDLRALNKNIKELDQKKINITKIISLSIE